MKKINILTYGPLFSLAIIDVFWKNELEELFGNKVLMVLFAVVLLIPAVKEAIFFMKIKNYDTKKLRTYSLPTVIVFL